jgi:hypothetical protein
MPLKMSRTKLSIKVRLNFCVEREKKRGRIREERKTKKQRNKPPLNATNHKVNRCYNAPSLEPIGPHQKTQNQNIEQDSDVTVTTKENNVSFLSSSSSLFLSPYFSLSPPSVYLS